MGSDYFFRLFGDIYNQIAEKKAQQHNQQYTIVITLTLQHFHIAVSLLLQV